MEDEFAAPLGKSRGVDDPITRTGTIDSKVLATLRLVELKRLIRRLPGLRFVRI